MDSSYLDSRGRRETLNKENFLWFTFNNGALSRLMPRPLCKGSNVGLMYKISDFNFDMFTSASQSHMVDTIS